MVPERLKPRTLMVWDKEGNILRNKKKHGLNIMKSTLNELQDGTDNSSGEECTMCVKTAETTK